MAHDVTITGTNTFASLDGSSSDHDGAANGVFTVNDGNLVVNGVVNCNDDTGASDSACAMAFAIGGNMSVNAGGALYAENRSGSGNGGAITLTVGGNLTLSGNAIVSAASKSSSGATGGAITANVNGTVAIASGSTIDSGSANARGGAIAIAAAGLVTVDGNVLSGPSRTILSTRLSGGAALDGGTSSTVGGAITISSSTFTEPAVVVGPMANIVSQGGDGGAGPVTLDGCGITVRGLIAALSRKDGAAKVSIRSGKDILIDGRDLGATGIRMGRVRADAPTGTALNKGVDIFATETIDIHGPASGLYAVTSLPGLHDAKSYGGLIRITSIGDAVNGSGNMIDDGHSASGDTGGTVEIAAKEDVTLNTAVIRAVGDFNTNNANRGGGAIRVRSYSGDVIWTNGLGEVRPVGSTSNLPLADQGSIVLTACGTVNTTGSTFPVMGTATSVFPETHTGVCSPSAPSLPAGVLPLITCNTPPVANDTSASTNEDNTVTIMLSSSDADGDPLTFSIVSGPSNGTLGAIIPTGPTTATVDYSPNANYNGGDSFVFRANDGNGGTDDATVTITIVSVNDAPSFLAGPTVSVFEDSGAQSYPNWAGSISPGPSADESGQIVTFTVTAADPSLFAVQPAVSSNGTLTFTPAANASGSSSISIVAHDDGGIANGGDDTSDPQTSSISITAVNDKPSFTGGGNVTVNEDSGPYSASWASSISAGPGESGQSVNFTVTNSDSSLFSAQPAVSASGTLTFTPAANANGFVTVTVTLHDDGGTANGGDDTSAPQTFTLTINAVNDAPSFIGGGDVTVNEDSGSYSAMWASAINANESGQSVSFTVSNSSNAFFTAQPAIDPSGNLTFTLAANAHGSVSVTVTLSDDGGTANGGDDTSDPQTSTIYITAINDAPSFTSGGNVTVNEDSGAHSAAWASAISAGPNESGQTVTFLTSTPQTSLFSVQPSVSSTGVLSFTPAPNAFGTATVTVFAQDNGGTANGGDDTSAPVTFDIIINGVNDGPAAGSDAWETEGNTELRVDHGAALTPFVNDTTPSGRGVLDNDADAVEGDPVIVTGVVGCTDTLAPYVCVVTGGTVTLELNGTFTFHPSPGATTASFQYTATDQPSVGVPASAIGSVTITIHDMIWYVNGSAAAGGNGTSASPFNNFASLNGSGDVDGAGDYIFVHTSAVADSIALEAGQKFWGEGVGLIIPRNLNGNGSPATLVAPGTRPAVSSVTDTVTVTGVAGVEIAGLTLTSASGNGIDVSSPAFAGSASVLIYSNAINAGQEGLDITSFNSGTTTVNINTTGIVSAGNGVDVTGGTGTVIFSYNSGSITSTANGIYADGASLDALYVIGLANVSVSGAALGDGINIQFARFDANPATAAFETVAAGVNAGTNLDPVGGAAVTLASVSGDVAFTTLSGYGSTSGVTIAGTGLFTGASGMRVASAGGSVSATAGHGVSVSNATIASSHLTFTSITATGGAYGIAVTNTGTAGGLRVTGSGTAGSGGTIHSVPTGVSLSDTAATLLRYMNLHDFSDFAIRGTSVHGFTLADSVVNGVNGNNALADEGSVKFTGLTGSASISNTSISGGVKNNVTVLNASGVLDRITFSNATIGANSTADGNDGVYLEAAGSAILNATVQNSTFTSARGDLFQLGLAGTASSDFVFTGNTLSNNHPAIATGGGGVTILGGGSGVTLAYNISNNSLRDASGHALLIVKGIDPGTFSGTVANNSFGVIGVANSGSFAGSAVKIQNTGQGRVEATVTNNNIHEYNNFGIELLTGGGGTPQSGVLNAIITGNVISNPGTAGSLAKNGIHLNAGTTPGDTFSVCTTIGGPGALANAITGSGASGGTDFRLRQRQATTVRLPGYAGAPSDTAAVVAFVQSNNGGTPTGSAAVSTPPGGGFIGGASCP
ncbi:MAG TPA: Ig-like domain-containing protein [Thermoanaerobaculia bacterium]|nr:Ig-like domain-containing protein [Thermoanaerobaculia bacterium]